MNPKKYKIITDLLAPAIVITFALALESGVEVKWGMRVIAPCMVILLILINFFASFWSSLLSALLAWYYTAFVLPKHLPSISEVDANARTIVWGLMMLGMTFMIRGLRRHSEEGLRKKAEENLLISEALKSSEERTRSIIEFASDAFIGMDRKGHITDWNRQAEKMFGWSLQEVIGKMFSDVIIPHRYREAHTRGLKKYLETGEGAVLNKLIELSGMHRSGHELPIALTIYPIAHPDGVLFGSFLRDITEEKKAALVQNLQMEVKDILTKIDSMEEAFPLLLQRICKIMKWTAGEIWLEDNQQQKLSCKAGWTEDLGQAVTFKQESLRCEVHSQDFVLGRVWNSGKSWWIEDLTDVSLWSRFTETQSAGYKSAFVLPLLAAGLKSTGIIIFYDQKKMVWDSRLNDVMSEVGTYISLFIQRKQAKERLARLYQELELKVEERTRDLAAAYEQAQAANRLKDEFLATVSHELRTPLNVILGHSELLLEESLRQEEINEAHETIHRNAKNQMQIISDLLDISRIVMGKMQLEIENVNIVTATEQALKSLELSASAKDLTVSLEKEAHLGSVRGDAIRIQQILWNLFSNAVKFTPKHGKIKVDLRSEGSMVKIQVTDNGKGIEPEFLPYVFDRFRQEDASTTRRYGGLGLGLAIVKNIVDAHGGSIQVHSEGQGRGAQFTVLLPMTAFKERPDNQDMAVESRWPLQGLRILVVEDDKDTRNLLGVVLKRTGAVITLTGSAFEALESFKRNQPQIVLSDISMPDKNGYELISEIRSWAPDQGGRVAAIALTSHARQEEIDLAYKAGFDLHLPKPVDPRELLERLSDFAKHLK